MLRAAGLLIALTSVPQDPPAPSAAAASSGQAAPASGAAQQPAAAPSAAPAPGAQEQRPPALSPAEIAQDPDRLLGPGRALELTLDGAYELALRRNIGLQLAATDSQIATYRARGSWGAFDWVLAASAGYSDAEYQPQNVFGGGSETNEEYSIGLTKPLTTGGTFRFGFDTTINDTNSAFNVIPKATTDAVTLSYVQPLLRNGWSDYATSQQKLSEFEALRSDQAVRTARQKLLLDVANAYWDLVAAREQLDVSEKSLALSQAQVDQNTRRLEAGLGTEVEVLQAQADVAVREEQRLLREFEVRTAADGLRKLLFPGTDPALWDTALVPATPLPTEIDADDVPAWPVAMQTAISRRPELREQRTRIEEAELLHVVAQIDKKPQLDLDLSARGQGFSTDGGDAFDTALTYDYPTYRASVIFGLPIGNTTARYAEKAAWAEIRRARLTYDELETSVVADVRAAVRNVLYAAESVRATRKSLEFAERQLAAEQARYAVDQSTTFQVLQFQTDLSTAMSNERRSRVSFVRNLVRLQAAQGVLGDDLGS